jgi:hypothetical protein
MTWVPERLEFLLFNQWLSKRWAVCKASSLYRMFFAPRQMNFTISLSFT